MPVVILMQFENLVMSRQSQLTYVQKATKIVVIKLCDYIGIKYVLCVL